MVWLVAFGAFEKTLLTLADGSRLSQIHPIQLNLSSVHPYPDQYNTQRDATGVTEYGRRETESHYHITPAALSSSLSPITVSAYPSSARSFYRPACLISMNDHQHQMQMQHLQHQHQQQMHQYHQQQHQHQQMQAAMAMQLQMQHLHHQQQHQHQQPHPAMYSHMPPSHVWAYQPAIALPSVTVPSMPVTATGIVAASSSASAPAPAHGVAPALPLVQPPPTPAHSAPNIDHTAPVIIQHTNAIAPNANGTKKRPRKSRQLQSQSAQPIDPSHPFPTNAAAVPPVPLVKEERITDAINHGPPADAVNHLPSATAIVSQSFPSVAPSTIAASLPSIATSSNTVASSLQPTSNPLVPQSSAMVTATAIDPTANTNSHSAPNTTESSQTATETSNTINSETTPTAPPAASTTATSSNDAPVIRLKHEPLTDDSGESQTQSQQQQQSSQRPSQQPVQPLPSSSQDDDFHMLQHDVMPSSSSNGVSSSTHSGVSSSFVSSVPPLPSLLDLDDPSSSKSRGRRRTFDAMNPSRKLLEMAALREIGFEPAPIGEEDLTALVDTKEGVYIDLFRQYLTKVTMTQPHLRKSQAVPLNEFTSAVLVQMLNSLYACSCGMVKYGQKLKALHHVINKHSPNAILHQQQRQAARTAAAQLAQANGNGGGGGGGVGPTQHLHGIESSSVALASASASASHPSIKAEALPSECCNCHQSQDELLQCSACMTVVYCTPDCQRAHWPIHKVECQKRRRARELAMADQTMPISTPAPPPTTQAPHSASSALNDKLENPSVLNSTPTPAPTPSSAIVPTSHSHDDLSHSQSTSSTALPTGTGGGGTSSGVALSSTPTYLSTPPKIVAPDSATDLLSSSVANGLLASTTSSTHPTTPGAPRIHSVPSLPSLPPSMMASAHSHANANATASSTLSPPLSPNSPSSSPSDHLQLELQMWKDYAIRLRKAAIRQESKQRKSLEADRIGLEKILPVAQAAMAQLTEWRRVFEAETPEEARKKWNKIHATAAEETQQQQQQQQQQKGNITHPSVSSSAMPLTNGTTHALASSDHSNGNPPPLTATTTSSATVIPAQHAIEAVPPTSLAPTATSSPHPVTPAPTAIDPSNLGAEPSNHSSPHLPSALRSTNPSHPPDLSDMPSLEQIPNLLYGSDPVSESHKELSHQPQSTSDELPASKRQKIDIPPPPPSLPPALDSDDTEDDMAD